jgi:hypothetical protein
MTLRCVASPVGDDVEFDSVVVSSLVSSLFTITDVATAEN